jgi:DNA primase
MVIAMQTFKNDSLEILRQRIDLVEVLSPHLQLKRFGSNFKALCPFHEEKTPSFLVKRGDTHYHCFGCGAHGDAIAFLMGHLKLTFSEAVEMLAEQFQVPLEREEFALEKGKVSKVVLKDTLEKAARFYHFCLLHTKEGCEALHYLYQRGIDLDFIRYFQLGLSPSERGIFWRAMRLEKINDDVLHLVGLLGETRHGKFREFFSERIMFPIRDGMGSVIGFSSRKYKEATFGGKYINTPETPLFKKSQVLFGLSYSRQRIAKERKALIVEGQIDALRLIKEGFNFVVAGQGTAFGEGHVSQLIQLGVNQVYLAFDADKAGQDASEKVGDLFQKRGIGVFVLSLPAGQDPDSLLREQGPEEFTRLLEGAHDYLTFLVAYHSLSINPNTPSGKNELVKIITTKIRSWDESVMVHESLRRLAELLNMPQEVVGIYNGTPPNDVFQKKETLSPFGIDPDKILEADLLRWLILGAEQEPKITAWVAQNLVAEDFWSPICRDIFSLYFKLQEAQMPCDLLSLGAELSNQEEQAFLSALLEKKINFERLEIGVKETIQKILLRKWMHEREAVKAKIQSGRFSEEEVQELVKNFDLLKKNPPSGKY